MKKYLVLFLVFSVSVFAQKIKGIVKDAATAEVIPFASVFFNNTSYHTETDSVGVFSFNQLPEGEYTLVVRNIGYNVYTKKINIIDRFDIILTIDLLPDKNQLSEVKIVASKDKVWSKHLQTFEKQFLGDNQSSQYCKILNPWILDFEENKGILAAKANDVLEIDNQFLGYKIKYSLAYFKYDGTQVSYAGYTQFTPYFTNDQTTKEYWADNRQNAYRTSDLYFFKSLINKKTADFEVFVDKYGEDPSKRNSFFYQNQSKKLRALVLDSLVKVEKEGTIYTLRVPERLEIHHRDIQGDFSIYKDKPCQVFWIETNGQPVRFNKDGLVLNPQHCSFSGYISSKRVADMLPIDFEEILPITPNVTKSKWQDKVETPFFTVNKPYYFSKDIIDLQGIMQYKNPKYADSLSKLIHIELLNPQTHQLIVHQRVSIDEGLFRAKIVLNNAVQQPTTYLLRVYTHWMLNFGDNAYAYRWVSVLPKNQNFKTDEPSQQTKQLDVAIVDSSLIINFTEPIAKDIFWATISITQENIKERNTICYLPTITIPKSDFVPLYAIEKGINISGKLLKPRIKKGGNVVLFSAKQQQSFFATLNEDGKFRFDDLPLDSIQTVLLKFSDFKGNHLSNALVVFDTTATTPKWTPVFEPTNESKSIEPNNDPENWAKDGILIEDVIVKAPRQIKPMQSIYKNPDHVVHGKDLFDKSVGMNILSALQGRVPGINIIEFPDEAGFQKLVITMRMGGTARGFQKGIIPQPLVLVDGVPFENINQLSSIPASQVERIEVVNRAETMLGLRGYVGVISIITKNALANQPIENNSKENLTSLIINGFDWPNISKLPPSQFYWHSINLPSATIKVPLPIAKRKYRVTLEGITIVGKPFRCSQVITVELLDSQQHHSRSALSSDIYCQRTQQSLGSAE
jgi:hypothetical protein